MNVTSLSPAALVQVLATSPDTAPLVLRLALGTVVGAHGLQKLFGWFGGYGFEGTQRFFTDVLGIPWVLGLAAILAESVGAAALIAGAATRLAALAVGITLATAAVLVHLPHGFFMNWGGDQAGEGLEFFLLAVPMAATLVVSGGGRWSLDRRWAQRPPQQSRGS